MLTRELRNILKLRPVADPKKPFSLLTKNFSTFLLLLVSYRKKLI